MWATACALLQALVELADAGAAGEVVHPHRAAERPSDLRVDEAVLREQRDEERQQPHEVRRVAAQPLPLAQRLVHEAHVAVLQVAQAAVHELRALRRRAAGEVVPLDERGAQPAAGGIERHAGAGDPAADHEHVELRRRPAAPATGRGRTNPAPSGQPQPQAPPQQPPPPVGARGEAPPVVMRTPRAASVVSTWPVRAGSRCVGVGHRSTTARTSTRRPGTGTRRRATAATLSPTTAGRQIDQSIVRHSALEPSEPSIRRVPVRTRRRSRSITCTTSPSFGWPHATISLTWPPRTITQSPTSAIRARRIADASLLVGAVEGEGGEHEDAAEDGEQHDERDHAGEPRDAGAVVVDVVVLVRRPSPSSGAAVARAEAARGSGRTPARRSGSDSTRQAAFSSRIASSAWRRCSAGGVGVPVRVQRTGSLPVRVVERVGRRRRARHPARRTGTRAERYDLRRSSDSEPICRHFRAAPNALVSGGSSRCSPPERRAHSEHGGWATDDAAGGTLGAGSGP